MRLVPPGGKAHFARHPRYPKKVVVCESYRVWAPPDDWVAVRTKFGNAAWPPDRRAIYWRIHFPSGDGVARARDLVERSTGKRVVLTLDEPVKRDPGGVTARGFGSRDDRAHRVLDVRVVHQWRSLWVLMATGSKHEADMAAMNESRESDKQLPMHTCLSDCGDLCRNGTWQL
jgi:hypothetical protein